MTQSRRSWNTVAIHEYIKAKHPLVVLPLGEITSVTQKMTWGCSICGKTWNTDFHHLRRRVIACPHCSRRATLHNMENLKKFPGADSTRLTVAKIKERLPEGVELVSETYKNIKIPLEWRCTSCRYVWSAIWPYVLYNGRLCPQCSPHRILPLFSMLARLRDRTDLSYCANYSGCMKPCDWRCSVCDFTWVARPTDVIRRNQGCPVCFPQYKREKQLGSMLRGRFKVRPQYRISCPPEIRRSKIVRVDHYLPEISCVVEHHGAQHFQFHPFFHRNSLDVFSAQQARDAWVRDYCVTNTLSYVVITQYEDLKMRVAELEEQSTCLVV